MVTRGYFATSVNVKRIGCQQRHGEHSANSHPSQDVPSVSGESLPRQLGLVYCLPCD